MSDNTRETLIAEARAHVTLVTADTYSRDLILRLTDALATPDPQPEATGDDRAAILHAMQQIRDAVDPGFIHRDLYNHVALTPVPRTTESKEN